MEACVFTDKQAKLHKITSDGGSIDKPDERENLKCASVAALL